MAKMRVVLGSVLKSKSGKPDYIKLRVNDLTRKTLTKLLETAGEQGFILNLESQKHRSESLESAVTAGKLSGEVADKIRQSIAQMPDFCRFEVVTYVEKESA